MKKLLIIGVVLLISFAFAQDAIAPKTVPLAQYNNLAKEYNDLQKASDSYLKRMVLAQDANTVLKKTLGDFASAQIRLEIAEVDSVLKVYGIARR